MSPGPTEKEPLGENPGSPRNAPGRRCVLLFARAAPQEARAKGIARARSLFALSRRRVLGAVSSLPGVDLLVVTEARGGRPTPAAPRELIQRGRSFGARLATAFAEARALGYTDIVAVPTDVPAMGRRQLAEAFRRLAVVPVVLGPCPDGGVYLIGCRGPAGALLAGVRWQTPAVLADLARNAGPPDGAALLGPLADVDSRADLQALLGAPGLDRALAALIGVLLRRTLLLEDGGFRPARRLVVAPRLVPRAPPAPARS